MSAVITEKSRHVSDQSKRMILPEVICAIYLYSNCDLHSLYNVNLTLSI